MKQSFNEDQLVKEENERFESARERWFFIFLVAFFTITILYVVIKFVVIPWIKLLF